jgi:NAD(P)-dependent dehydrogenase (short-subunit alcohol dehydrogenase family)
LAARNMLLIGHRTARFHQTQVLLLLQSRQQCQRLDLCRIAYNVVAPSPIATGFSGGMVRDNPMVQAAIAHNTALGRAGLPEDAGPVIAALLSGQGTADQSRGRHPHLASRQGQRLVAMLGPETAHG